MTDATPIISLGEGNTPLIPAPGLSREVGAEVYLKLEGANPTASFKDRGMTMAVSKAREKGAEAVSCASTGNTAASAAAYASRAGLACIVLLPEGKVALGKLASVAHCGARIVTIQGNFDEALEIVRFLTGKFPVAVVNPINPYCMDGPPTGASEPTDAFAPAPTHQGAPHHARVPGGGGGPHRHRKAGGEPGDGGERDPDWQPRQLADRRPGS